MHCFIQGVHTYNFWDLQKIVLCKIHTSRVVHRLKSTSTIFLIRNSISTNFSTIVLKIILVEFVLVKTIQVGDPLYNIDNEGKYILLILVTFPKNKFKEMKIDYLILRHPFRSLLNLFRMILTTSLSF